MTDYSQLIARNATRWATAKLTRGPEFAKVAARLCAPDAKAIYQRIGAATGVPWFIVAVIHEREAGGPPHFDRHLGQGDPLSAKTVHVPAGRGPFLGPDAFYRGALDALQNCAPFAAKWTDWSAGGALTLLERYNGLAYANHDRPSPYVWSGTDIYDPPTGPGGKVLVDHGPIENVVDKQLGCAGLILAMMALDPSIRLGTKPVVVVPPPAPAPKPQPAPSTPIPAPTIPVQHKSGIAATIIAMIAAAVAYAKDHPGAVIVGAIVAAIVVFLIVRHALQKKG